MLNGVKQRPTATETSKGYIGKALFDILITFVGTYVFVYNCLSKHACEQLRMKYSGSIQYTSVRNVRECMHHLKSSDQTQFDGNIFARVVSAQLKLRKDILEKRWLRF